VGFAQRGKDQGSKHEAEKVDRGGEHGLWTCRGQAKGLGEEGVEAGGEGGAQGAVDTEDDACEDDEELLVL